MAFSVNHILFPTDFSENAEHALPFAAEIAKKTGAQITLFHASQESMDLAPDFEKPVDQVITDSSKQFDQLLRSLDDQYQKLNISTVVEDGQTTTAILNQIDKHNADLIVMGTKGATGDRKAIFGSIASSVIKKSPVPILTIPNTSTLKHFQNIVFTSDYKEGDLVALDRTASLAKLFDSTVDILHISYEKNLETKIKFRGFQDLVKEHISYDKITFHHQYDLDFFPAIGEFLSDRPHSLLVMVRYKKTFWENISKRNHSKEMAFYSNVPLLVLLGKKKEGIKSIL